MIVSLLAAVAENGVIGRGNTLPWHLPADLKRFKALTLGHVMIMGRKTFDSIGQALPGRRTIVLSRRGAVPSGTIEVAATLPDALALVEGEDEVFVVGGAEVYREAFPLADRLYLTEVHAEVEGDTHFPRWDRSEWLLVWEESHPADERHRYPYSFRRYDRRPRAGSLGGAALDGEGTPP